MVFNDYFIIQLIDWPNDWLNLLLIIPHCWWYSLLIDSLLTDLFVDWLIPNSVFNWLIIPIVIDIHYSPLFVIQCWLFDVIVSQWPPLMTPVLTDHCVLIYSIPLMIPIPSIQFIPLLIYLIPIVDYSLLFIPSWLFIVVVMMMIIIHYYYSMIIQWFNDDYSHYSIIVWDIIHYSVFND